MSNIGLFVGGSWHDFARFAECVARWLGGDAERLLVLPPSALAKLDELPCSTAILYTCLDEHTPLRHAPEDLEALETFVRRGGGLVALHATAVAAKQHQRLANLIGGHFESHPPKGRFLVSPARSPSPVTHGFAPFEVNDERYELTVHEDVSVELTTDVDERALPLAWTRLEERGRVYYLSLGHDESVWNEPSYSALLLRAVRWATPDASGT
jgi:type 1 glutamine amidotransferase